MKNTNRKNINYPNFPAYRDPPANPVGDLRGSGRQVVLSPAQDLAADPRRRFNGTIGIVPKLFPKNNRA
jgi:hypothetical protein